MTNIDIDQVEALMLKLTQHACDSITISTESKETISTITITKSLHLPPKRELTEAEKTKQLYGKVDPTKQYDDFAAKADVWASTKRVK
jgi:hypothetical protein